jgi:hypothetical protein
MTAATAYPLCWPETFPRSKSREKGRFSASLSVSLKNVETSLKRFGIDSNKTISNIVLSSNCTLGITNPSDPGVAVWFVWDDLHVCIPVDRYLTPAANLQAIHHVIEARRTELRHGTLALVRATMTGFLALPAPEIRWWEILGISQRSQIDEIENAFKKLAKECHPDRGGSTAMMAKLNEARAAAMKAAR